jgi:hypothetical protein
MRTEIIDFVFVKLIEPSVTDETHSLQAIRARWIISICIWLWSYDQNLIPGAGRKFLLTTPFGQPQIPRFLLGPGLLSHG